MPGVWVQERFEDPSQIPDGASVNGRRNKWETVKNGKDIDTGNWSLIFGTFHEWTPSTKVDGVFGPDWLWMPCSYFDYNPSPLVITGHRYYAGNSGTNLNDGGVLVATFTIRVFREGHATHERSDGG